ncbi:MAG: GntR family transcriptional regulator [Proteobacteria bacterium]|nr:GntR family transcriptional regulator [Pseudomonadota bacterium]
MTEDPIRQRTLPTVLAGRLRQDILSGVHAAGMQLRQDAIAATYGVSRIPVREALLQLEAEGLVEIIPHRGAIVTPLTRQEVNDVFDLRVMLEPRLLIASIPHLDASDFAAIATVQAAFDAAVAGNDRGRLGALNASLHLALYARATLPRTRTIVAGLLNTSERYTRLQLSTAAASKQATEEHAEIVALCQKGDGEGAAARLVAHIEAVRHDLDRIIATG